MSVYLEQDRKAYRYKFVFRGTTYKGSTGQHVRADAEAVEAALKQRLRRVAGGLIDLRDAPSFQEWAGVYYTFKATAGAQNRPVKRPEKIDELIGMVLRFFGRRPSDATTGDPTAPYHDLTLADPILEPEWLDRFEDWMTARGLAGSTKNHYRSTVSGMYRVALLPRYRRHTGVTMNPLIGVLRDRPVVRDASVTPEQVQAWIAHASYHVRLAMAIAALAPKLRVGNVLALEWAVHLDRGLTRIVVAEHKTDRRTGRPLVQEVSAQLRAILEDARRRTPGRYVVSYQGRGLHSIRGGVQAAAERAGFTYGRDVPGGVTFHTLRHSVATWLAEQEGLTEPVRAALLAHSDIATTQRYTHLRPIHERRPLEQLSAQLTIAETVTQPWGRWSASRGDKRDHSTPETAEKPKTRGRRSPRR